MQSQESPPTGHSHPFGAHLGEFLFPVGPKFRPRPGVAACFVRRIRTKESEVWWEAPQVRRYNDLAVGALCAPIFRKAAHHRAADTPWQKIQTPKSHIRNRCRLGFRNQIFEFLSQIVLVVRSAGIGALRRLPHSRTVARRAAATTAHHISGIIPEGRYPGRRRRTRPS